MIVAIKKHIRDFIAILAVVLTALLVGGYILSQQHFYLPGWVPVIGSDFYEVKAEFETAQAITPGQGQTVVIAGVQVGEISNVAVKDGRAVVTMQIKQKYAPVYRDATMLLRPKTGLNDMAIELNPGTKAAGALKESDTLSVTNTAPNLNSDEVLAALDGDTREYLRLLLGDGGRALKGQGKNLSKTLRRVEPTSRDLLKITRHLAQRRAHLRRLVHNFQLLANAVGDKDKQLAQLVDSSNAVFEALSQEDQNLQASLEKLPGTLDQTQRTLGKLDALAAQVGPAMRKLRPGAAELENSLQSSQVFLRKSTPIIKKKIRPFAKRAITTADLLAPTATNLNSMMTNLVPTLEVLNTTLNALAYNPSGKDEEGYLFWFAWAGHNLGSSYSLSDAHGPLRRGIVLASCGSLDSVEQITGNPVARESKDPVVVRKYELLNLLVGLTNLPKKATVC